MAIDYIKSKVDFYRNYEDENYESLYNKEIKPACDKDPGELQRKVRNVREQIGGMHLIWNDSVDSEFRNYIDYCDNYLQNVENSISSNFSGKALTSYERIKSLIETLKEQNETYRSKWDENPKNNRNQFFVDPEKDINGNIIKEGYFDQESYDLAVSAWEAEVGELAGSCLTTIASIEEERTVLNEINNAEIEGLETSLGVNIPEAEFLMDLKNTPTASNDGTFDNYVEVTLGGVTFNALANIKSAKKQPTDYCLAYANGYAKIITEKNGYNVDNNGRNGAVCTYSSTNPDEIYQIAANEYKNGRAVVLEVGGTQGGVNRHFVAVVGFEEGTDFNNIKPSNLLILDPSSGGYKQLSTKNGGQRRDLKSARTMNYNDVNSDYTINVYSDVDYAEMFSNTKRASGTLSQPGAGSDIITI